MWYSPHCVQSVGGRDLGGARLLDARCEDREAAMIEFEISPELSGPPRQGLVSWRQAISAGLPPRRRLEALTAGRLSTPTWTWTSIVQKNNGHTSADLTIWSQAPLSVATLFKAPSSFGSGSFDHASIAITSSPGGLDTALRKLREGIQSPGRWLCSQACCENASPQHTCPSSRGARLAGGRRK